MDILNFLDKELNEKGKTWTLEEKSRFLYLQSCALFSYDSRYRISSLYDLSLFYKIRNLKINLRKVFDRRVICNSHINEVIKTIYKELINLEVNIHGDQHVWGSIEINKEKIYLDSTSDSDLARVKYGLTTYGYTKGNYPNYNEELKEIDQKIGYIKNDYYNREIQDILDLLYYEYYKFQDSHDYFNYKLNYFFKMINELLKKSKIKYYSDAEFLVSYLFRKIFYEKYELLKERFYHKLILKNEWEFVNLYFFPIAKEHFIYFVLEKKEEYYEIQLISKEKINHYFEDYQTEDYFLKL